MDRLVVALQQCVDCKLPFQEEAMILLHKILYLVMENTKATIQDVPVSVKIAQFQQKVRAYTHEHLPTTLSEYANQLIGLIKIIDTDVLDDQEIIIFIDKNFENVMHKLGNEQLVKEKIDLYQELAKTVFQKLMHVFEKNKKYGLVINSLKAIFKKQNSFFHKEPKLVHYSFFNPSKDVTFEPTPNFIQCLEIIKQGFGNTSKAVWSMELSEIFRLFELFTLLEKSKDAKVKISDLYSEYFAEILAFFQSGRPELIKYSNFEVLQQISHFLQKSITANEIKYHYETMIPTLSKTLIAMGGEGRISGIKLLNNHCKKIFQYDFSAEAERLKNWIVKNDVYIMVLTKDVTEEEFDQSKYILKNFGKTLFGQEKTNHLLKLLRENNNENKFISKFCLKKLEVYSMNASEKLSLVQYLITRSDLYENYHEYSECIDELVYRLEYNENIVEPVFNILLKVVRASYYNISEAQKGKLISNIRMASKAVKSSLKQKTQAEKVEFIKGIVSDILKQVNFLSILLFNAMFEQGDMHKCLSNTLFQGIMNYVIQDLQLLPRIFQFLEKEEKSEMQPIVKTIKFVSNKCWVKIDVTRKYLKTLTKYPELYQSLLANEGYMKVKDQMQAVLELLQKQPDTPFHILKTTFFKANHQMVLEYTKQPNLLENKKQQLSLKRQPNELDWYEEIISLMEEAPNSVLRHQIAEFIVSLHINYGNADIRADKQILVKYMASIIEYFQQNTKSYRKKQSSSRSVLANFELIQEMIKFTDLLGPGNLPPHNSLVSTSTIALTILNNVTFGDDVKKSVSKNFPSNMVLFDMITQVGLAFKCGPEDIVLRQGDRFISIIYNGHVLENLNLASEEMVAEKNEANMLKPPEVFIKTGIREELADIYKKILKEVFDRFSFEGKMGEFEAVNYIRQASGSYVMGYDRRIKEMFEDFDKDKDGILTYDDFQKYHIKNMTGMYENYYRKQFITNLENLRYRKNMTLFDQPLNISQKQPKMMRFMIPQYPEIYQELFLYAKDENAEIANKAKQLLLNLPTCPTMQSDQPQFFQFQNDSQFMVYYKLILIENQLSRSDPKLPDQQRKLKRAEKTAEFINNKYNKVIFDLLQKFYNMTSEEIYTYKSFTICLKILRSLINIDNLSETKISSLQFDPQSIHSLPQTTFFAQETIKSLKSKNIINFEVLLVLQLTQQNINTTPIIASCFNQDKDIRRICCNFIYLWEQKVKWKNNLFQINIPEKNSEDWFDLLSVIIEKTEVVNMKDVLANTLDNLQKRQENVYNRNNVLLYGYLKILYSLLVKYKNLCSEDMFKKTIAKLLDKTLSQKSRAILYDILIATDDQSLLAYISNMLTEILPSQECEVRSQYMGLKNLGATCYMNSILQQFFMIQKFRHLILNRKVPPNCKISKMGDKQIEDDFMFQLQKMFCHLESSQKKSFMPKQFCFSNKDFDGKPINTSIQEDSHEFLNRLLENIQNSCKQDSTLESLQELCEMKTLSEYECGQCKNRIDKIESHYSCMLEVKEQPSLDSSLKRFNDKEQIEGYNCENCKKKVRSITKRTYFHELPEVMILNLQRIIYDPKKGDKIKVHSQLKFPLELDFQDYIKNQEQKSTAYRLKGVVIHTGTSQGGHYYSLIRDNKEQGSKWLKFNDQNVVDFDEKQIERQGFGGFEANDNNFREEISYSTNAYILFYERVELNKNHIGNQKNIFSEQIHTENMKLIKQIQVHQECFFVAIHKLNQKYRMKNIDQSMKHHNFAEVEMSKKQKQTYLKLLDINNRALSFMSVFTSLKGDIRTKISRSLLEIYHILPDQTSTYFSELNMYTFTENLISHSNASYRKGMARIFKRNMFTYTRFFEINIDDEERQESKLMRKVLDALLAQIQGERFFSSLSKVEAYFELIEHLVQYEPGIRRYLVSKNLFFFLLDMIMGRQSTYMKHHPKVQDLPANLVDSIFKIIQKVLYCKKNFSGAHSNDKSYAPFVETTSMQAKILTSSTFYKRIYRLNYDHEVVKQIMTFYSFEDANYTLMVCELLLQQINKGDQGHIGFLISKISGLLTIQDQWHMFRLGALLGFPQACQLKNDCFCLRNSATSENTSYASSIFPNRPERNKFDSDKKPLLEIFFLQKLYKNKQLALLSLKMILILAEGMESFFNYLMRIPPPNYNKRTLFDMIPSMIQKLADDQDVIIDHKVERITEAKNLIDILFERIKVSEKKVPIKPYIIGKTVNSETVEEVKVEDFTVEMKKYETYVLENQPTGTQNNSMDKNFTQYDFKGVANLFIDYRSKRDYKPEKQVETKPVLYTLRGKTKVKLHITFLQENNEFTCIVDEGQFSLNFPYFKEGKLCEIFKIEVFKERVIEANPDDIKKLFGEEKEEEKKKEEEKSKAGSNSTEVSTNQVPTGMIACPICTYHNSLHRTNCELCDNALFS